MKKFVFSARRPKVLALGLAVGAVVIVSLAGAYAFREVFARPGEAALRLVPADSILVASIDLTPSPTQALAFKHIDDSLTRNGMDKIMEHSVLDIIEKGGLSDSLRPYVLRNGAVCVTPDPTKKNDEDVMAFVALNDGPAAAQILQKSGQPLFYKGTRYYRFGKQSTIAMVIDDLLVITDKPEMLFKVKEVHDGLAKAITTVPEYIAARKQVADDANIMCYISPNFGPAIAKGSSSKDVPMPQWAAIGLAIRDGGIGVSCSGKMDVSKNASLADLATIPAVRSDLFDVLPSGSYGMIAVSDPSEYFSAAQASLKDNQDIRKAIAQGEDGIQKGIGLSVQQDLVPALKGDTVAALYPSTEGQAAGLDLLVVVDDTNSANPSDAVERFRTFLEQQTAKEGNSPQMLVEQKTATGEKEYRVSDKIQQDMRKSMGDGMDPQQIKKDILIDKKTIAYAFVGKAVLAATSQELLDRAVACYESKTMGLSGDARFAPSKKELLDGSQSFATFSVARIAEGVKNTISTSKMSDKDRKLFNSILDAFQSLNDPLYIKGKATADGQSSGGVFIPLDYDKIVDLIGEQVNKK